MVTEMRHRESPDTEAGLVRLRTFNNEPEALLAKSLLDAAGIHCMLSRDDFGGMRPDLDTTRGIKLLVRSTDSKTAEEILGPEARKSK